MTTLQSLPAVFERLDAALRALPDWQAFLVVLVFSLAAAFALQKGGDIVIRPVTRRVAGEIDDIVLTTLHPPLYASVILIGLALAVIQFDIITNLPGVTADRTLSGDVLAGLLSVLTLLWAVTLVRIGTKVARELTGREEVETTVVPIFQNVFTAVVLAVALFLLLVYWNIDITPLLASAGIVGIVVGFAAKDTIANFFGSIALYLDGTYTIGDYVVLESGVRGRVEDVSIRSTVIRTRDDVLITVPNSVLNSAQITNESAPDRERRIRIPVGVAYGSDLEFVEAVLKDVAAEEPTVIEAPSPRVRIREFGDSAVNLELLAWIPDPVLRGRATHNLMKGVYTRFTEEGISIPFPQRDVTLTGTAAETPPAQALGDGGEE